MATTPTPTTDLPEHLTKREGDLMAGIVRDSPPEADREILWSVRHNLTQYYQGMISAAEVCDLVLRACNGYRDENLVALLGLERTSSFSGRPMVPERWAKLESKPYLPTRTHRGLVLEMADGQPVTVAELSETQAKDHLCRLVAALGRIESRLTALHDLVSVSREPHHTVSLKAVETDPT